MTAAAALFDPRMTLARPDLAEQALEGLLRASAFRAVTPMHCAVGVAPLWAEADDGAEQLDQLVFGEGFDVLDRRGDFVWGRARRDGMVGWVEADALAEGRPLATHRVRALWAEVRGDEGGELPLNALVVVAREDGADAVLADGARMDLDDLSPVGTFAASLLEIAEQFVGTPHEPGGRTPGATDCSGLVQQALYACGVAGPRHVAMQRDLGVEVAPSAARRGDLVLWDGHAGLMFGPGLVLHASGRAGEVLVEALDAVDVQQRKAGSGSPIYRRVL